MSIALQCPACGRQYRLKRELAGRRATCKCGQAMTVPAASADEGSAVDLDGLPALPAAPSSSAAAAIPEVPAEPAPAATEEFGGWGGPVSAAPIAGTGQLPRRKKRQESGMRVPIALLSIVYGACLFVWHAWGMILTFDLFSFISLDFVIVAVAGAVVAGGVLLLKNHRAGPATTGLACLLATFGPVYTSLRTGTMLLADLSPSGLPYVLLGLVLIAVAGVIITWCVREEKRRDLTSKYPPI